MQQTFGLKRFVVTHAAAAALSFGILLSAALGVTALTATGNLPWAHDNVAAVAAQQPLATAFSRFCSLPITSTGCMAVACWWKTQCSLRLPSGSKRCSPG